MTIEQRQSSWRDLIGPIAVALVALIAVVLTLDAAGDYPKLFEGPGITLDESFNVQMGVYQWKALREYNIALLHPDSVREIFGPGSNYNPDHPPLGRLWLGFWHDLVEWLFPPRDHPPNGDGIRFVTDCARVGSATAFALTVWLIGVLATKWYGRAGGIVAAVSLVLMPRVFAHAHLAALETFMNLTYSATVLAVAHWWGLSQRERGPSKSVAALTGVLFGLALLSKMQAVLIPPAVGLWALWHLRQRAIVPLAIFGLVGFVVFFAGWPWLWLDPVAHLREYFARTTGRAVLNCYYLGKVWPDKDVPWHYPFVMFAVTVPYGLHVLAALGIVGQERAWRQSREQLLLAAAAFPLVLFALPGVAVYDGERLFLVSYPIWAVLVGRGASIAWDWLRGVTELASISWLARTEVRVAVAGVFLAFQAVGLVVMHPCQLSYYNLLVGGLSGADRLGLERTYWQDSFTRSFLREVANAVPEGATLRVAPVLHQFQLDELQSQSPILRRKGIILVGPRDSEMKSMFLPSREVGVNGGGFTSFQHGFLTFFRRADVRDAWNAAGRGFQGYVSDECVRVSRLGCVLAEGRFIESDILRLNNLPTTE